MKVIQLNATCSMGSTGKICEDLSRRLMLRGDSCSVFYVSQSSDYDRSWKYMSSFEIKEAALKSRLIGNWGFNSTIATHRLICELDKISPDLIHLHNIHGHNCRLDLFMNYVKANSIKIVWTFHDCWAFTGYCTHFDMIDCDKWKIMCNKCPQKKEFSWLFDRSRYLFLKKKEILDGLQMTIVTPSRWLADKVACSFLSNYKLRVIPNGIDLSIFKYKEANVREQLGVKEKYMVLGVSYNWSNKKGLDVFIKLSKLLGSDYRIVLVGVDERIARILPNNIVSINRTKNQEELVNIYSAANVFVNPTREDNYPTVNMEALACGTPVVTFNTGGCSEIVDETSGIIVNKNDIESLFNAVVSICKEPEWSIDYHCLKKKIDKNVSLSKYLGLYDEVIK